MSPLEIRSTYSAATIKRADDRVERGVDALDDRAELEAHQLRVAAGLELAGHGRLAEPLRLADQRREDFGNRRRQNQAEGHSNDNAGHDSAERKILGGGCHGLPGNHFLCGHVLIDLDDLVQQFIGRPLGVGHGSQELLASLGLQGGGLVGNGQHLGKVPIHVFGRGRHFTLVSLHRFLGVAVGHEFLDLFYGRMELFVGFLDLVLYLSRAPCCRC